MEGKRLSQVLDEKKISTEPEKLSDFENVELTLRSFEVMDSAFGSDKQYVVLSVVDADGVQHMLTTGGATVVRVLKELDPETDFPCQVKFVKVMSGTGRKVWSIE